MGRTVVSGYSDGLENAFKLQMQKLGFSLETSLESLANENPCRVFVLTIYANNMRMPVRLRSYASREAVATSCTIVKAAKVTSAWPGEALPIKLGPSKVPHIGAGVGFTNPAKEALDEALGIWQLSKIGCLVSIGTGVMPPARLDGAFDTASLLKSLRLDSLTRLPELLMMFFKAATDSERVHEELSRDARLLGLKYFRFNVESGLDKVSWKEYQKADIIRSETELYMRKRETANSLAFSALYLLAG